MSLSSVCSVRVCCSKALYVETAELCDEFSALRELMIY